MSNNEPNTNQVRTQSGTDKNQQAHHKYNDIIYPSRRLLMLFKLDAILNLRLFSINSYVEEQVMYYDNLCKGCGIITSLSTTQASRRMIREFILDRVIALIYTLPLIAASLVLYSFIS